jgi:hypothetical protein
MTHIEPEDQIKELGRQMKIMKLTLKNIVEEENLQSNL